MHRGLCLLSLIATTFMAASCGSSTAAPVSRILLTRTIITSVVIVPAEVHAGQAVLVDYTLGTAQIEASRDPVDAMEHAPYVRATAGQLLPLLPEVYTPGGPVPSPAEAQAAIDATNPLPPNIPFEHVPVDLAFRSSGHVYFLYVAPAAAGEEELTFFCGQPDGDGTAQSLRRLRIDVEPQG
jgi:hypothetical protein